MRPSRRQFIATVGVSLLSGCTELANISGHDNQSPPAPFLTEPADWTHPRYNPANTNAAPIGAVPDSIAAAPDWIAKSSASEIDHVTRPVIADGIAYLGLTGIDRSTRFERLIAVDIETGTERWQFEVRGSSALYPPTVAGESVFWLASADTTYAFNPADGSVRWKYDGTNHEPPLAAHGLVLTVGGTLRRPVLRALDPQTGTEYWTRETNDRDWTLLAADDDVFYATLHSDTDARPPELHAIDPMSGETRWATSRVAPRTATVGASTLFTSTGPPGAQELLALDIATREVEWTETRDLQREISEKTVNGRQSVAAVTAERVLIHLDFHGYAQNSIECRDAATGDVLWTVADAGDGRVQFGKPIIAGDLVYTLARREDSTRESVSTLRVLDLLDGTELFRATFDQPVSEAFAISDSRLFSTTWVSRRTVGLTVR